MRNLILLIVLLLAQPAPSQYGGTLHLGYVMEMQTLDPHRVNVFYEEFDSSIAVINQVFEGLVQYRAGAADIEPLLAESWEVSDNNVVYTFHLKKNVFWQDGNDLFPEGKSRKVTAEDFVYSWDRATAPETLSPMKDFFSSTAHIKSWKATGTYTFEVTLTQPNPSFLHVLPFPCFCVVPKEAEQYGLEGFSLHAVGTGPFEVDMWRESVVLRYNEDYAEEPYVTGIEYRQVKPEELFTEFERGELDWCLIPSDQWEQFSGSTVVAVPNLEVFYIGMNCLKKPFSDKRVRQAINYVLKPGKEIDAIYKGRAVPAQSILPPGLACYKEREDLYPENLEKAVQLLTEAGYTGEPRLTVELKSSESYIQQQFNERYRAQLERVGIQLEITYLDAGSLLQAVDAGDTQLYTLGWYADWPCPDQFLFLFGSSNWGPGGNGCFYANKNVDELLEKAGEADPAATCALYQRAEEIILEDAVWVLQWRRVDNYAVQEWIQGFHPGGMGEQYTKLNSVVIAPSHRQTTRLPQPTPAKERSFSYGRVGIAVVAVIVIIVLLKRKKK